MGTPNDEPTLRQLLGTARERERKVREIAQEMRTADVEADSLAYYAEMLLRAISRLATVTCVVCGRTFNYKPRGHPRVLCGSNDCRRIHHTRQARARREAVEDDDEVERLLAAVEARRKGKR